MEDRILLEMARGGDEPAFTEVYRRHRDAVFRFAWRMTGAADTAEDVAHDCWLAVLAGKARWVPEQGPLLPFLLGVTRNLALRRMRYQARECENEGGEDRPAADDPLREAMAGEIGAAVARAVGELPPLQREALVLFEYEGLTLDEIARVAAVPVGAVKARLFRARETLRRKLALVRS